MKPLLLINLKAYEEGTGARAVYLAHIAQKVAREEGVEIALAVQTPDIFKLHVMTDVQIYAQHVDSVDFGAHTGAIHPYAVKEAGAVGTVLNHAEKHIPLEQVEEQVKQCKAIGLKTIVCTDSVEKAEKISSWGPDYIAFEDPALIGTLQSVSRLRSEKVKQFVQTVNGTTTPLCGAGIANGEDCRAARELGTWGGIVATAIVKAEDPERVIREMARALK